MNLKKIDFKAVNVMFYIAGMFSIAFGVVFMIRSDIGTSSWDSLHWSINQLFELRFGVMWFTVGLATIVVATTFMIIVIIMNKSIRYLIMSIPILSVGFMIDFIAKVLLPNFEPELLGFQLLTYLGGALLLPLGGSLLIISTFPAGIFDEFNLTLMRKFKSDNLVLIRVIMELLAVLTALILGSIAGIGFGNVKIGTLIFSLIVGKILKTYLIIFEKLGLYEITKNEIKKEIE